MSSDSKSLPSQNPPQRDTAAAMLQKHSQTMPHLPRHYFPAGPRSVGSNPQDVDSGGWSLQRPPHTFWVVRNDGQIRFCGLIRLGAALLPIP